MENQNLPSDRSKAIEELVNGREYATKLRQVIQNSNGEDGSTPSPPFAEDLVEKVLSSFTNTLLLLNIRNSESDEVISQMQPTDSSCWIPAKSEDSEDSCRSSTIKDRRGCYKRRRTSQTWEKVTEAPTGDDHGWRKYGQKMILNAKYPRSYFRCTHKFDQSCLATKQVQRVQEEPPLFRTTYYGNHTCRNLLNPEIILESGSSDSSILLSFHNSLPTKQDLPFFSSSLPSMKKQFKEEEIPPSSSDDYLLEPELTFDSSRDVISDALYDSVELNNFEPFVEL